MCSNVHHALWLCYLLIDLFIDGDGLMERAGARLKRSVYVKAE